MTIRALIVSNMASSAAHPARGVFVRDQVAALRALPGLDVELFEFAPGTASYPLAAMKLRLHYRRAQLDIVHAHYGLTAWPSLAVPAAVHAVTLHGSDLRIPRSRRATLAALGRMDLVAAVSETLAGELPPAPRPPAILPCGVAMDRFRAIPRDAARLALGLPRDQPCLLFPADPKRAVKRFDRAQALAGDTRLLTLGSMAPEHVTLAINAANAVLVPSEAEGFGLAVLEALACDVPVLATPVGNHHQALTDLPGTLCAPFDLGVWSAALAPHLRAADPRVDGRARAELFSSTRMAQCVLTAWEQALATDRGDS